MFSKDDPKVKAFLDSICKKVRNRKARAEIRDELLDHIEQALSEGKTLEAILEDFGDPKAIAGSFGEVHRPVYLTSPFLGAVISLSLMIGIIAVSEMVKDSLKHLRDATQTSIDANRIRFLEDQKVLSTESFFDIPGKEHDAGPFLNPKLKWGGRLVRTFEFLKSYPGIVVPRDVVNKMDHANNQATNGPIEGGWVKLYPLGLDKGIDFKWMSELSQFDHWDLFAWAPMKEHMTDMRQAAWWTFPGPDDMDLLQLGKIRLLRGLRTHDPITAFREVRQLGKLVYSNETMIGAVVGVVFLIYEREAYEEAVRQKMIRPDQWHPVSEEMVIRARRSIKAYPEFFQPGSPYSDLSLIAKGKVAKVGYCSALASDTIWAFILQNRLGSSRFPLETDFSPEIAKVMDVVKDPSNPCRLTYLKYVMQDPDAISYWFTHPLYADPETLRWYHFKEFSGYFLNNVSFYLPWIRQLAALEFQQIYFRDYMSNAYQRDLLPEERALLESK